MPVVRIAPDSSRWRPGFVVVATLLTPLFAQGATAWIPVVCAPLALVGVLDDRFNLPALWRYLAQILTAMALIAMATLPMPLWSLPLVLVMITAIINFFNFMDGLDGLVSSCGAVLMLASGQWILAGALLGFLLWNWSPARIFMGDVGSTYLGAVFAGLLLQMQQPLQALLLLLVATPLLADAFICVLRRWHVGQQIFQAHRLHLYQRLHSAGWPHARVSLLYLLTTTLLAFGFSTFCLCQPWWGRACGTWSWIMAGSKASNFLFRYGCKGCMLKYFKIASPFKAAP